jgi:hypothetical protein
VPIPTWAISDVELKKNTNTKTLRKGFLIKKDIDY